MPRRTGTHAKLHLAVPQARFPRLEESMTTFKEMIGRVRVADPRDLARRGPRPRQGRGRDRRARGRRMGPGPRARRRVRSPRLPGAPHRGQGPRPRAGSHPLLRRRHPLRAGRAELAGPRLHERVLDGGRLRQVEGSGLPHRDAGDVERRAEAALQPPSPRARSRRGGAGQAARVEGAARRGGRPRLARRPLPGRGRRRHHRRRRLRRRRPLEPAAADPAHQRFRRQSRRRSRRSGRCAR